MQIKVYKLPKHTVPIKEGVTTFADLYPPLEYDMIEVCDTCKKQECKCKQYHDKGMDKLIQAIKGS